MKRIVMMLMLVLGIFFSGNAQQKAPTAEELAKKNVDELEKRLKLSSTQKSVIYNYAFTLAKEQLAIYKKQQATGYNDEEMTRYYKFQNETNTNIKTVLKPEQITEYNKITEERLSGIDPTKKKRKLKKGEEEEKVVGIEGLKSGNH
ncbi:MAG: hypothetical protein V4541_05095 [Bacteroidota bacterium]